MRDKIISKFIIEKLFKYDFFIFLQEQQSIYTLFINSYIVTPIIHQIPSFGNEWLFALLILFSKEW